MISATSLNASSALNKAPQIPLGLDNGRMRVDSQKFLVPSLPVSARGLGSHHNHHHHSHHSHSHHQGGGDHTQSKRRERSIISGTGGGHGGPNPNNNPQPPSPQSDNPYSIHHQAASHHAHLSGLSHPYTINGLRSSYSSPGGTSSNGSNNSNSASPHNSNSPNSNNNPRSSPHYSHLSSSPRKDVHSPLYGGDVPGLSPGSRGDPNYPSRSSMPIPCSSPAAASSASPKSLHSHSPSNATPSGGNYSPKLPTGPAMLPPTGPSASDLSSLAAAGRLYPGFLPPHPSVPAHLNPAFYAAAAAAAASHSLNYPMFGPHYNHHTHSAAQASAYLDSFHSAILSRGPGDLQQLQQVQQQQQRSRSPSPQPPSRGGGGGGGGGGSSSYHHNQQQQSLHGVSPQSTSVTSFHNKLIESTSVSSERHGFTGHHHGHLHSSSSSNSNNSNNGGRYSPSSVGLSKGGPLGISGGIMNLPSSRLSNGGTSSQQKGAQAENLVVHKSPHTMNGYGGGHGGHGPVKGWVEHPGLTAERNKLIEMEAKDMRHSKMSSNEMYLSSKEAMKLHHHRMLTRSPDEMHSSSSSSGGQIHHQFPVHHMSPSKVPKALTFSSESFHSGHNGGGNKPSNIHRIPNPYAHMNGHGGLPQHNSPNHGILTDSNSLKKHGNSNHHGGGGGGGGGGSSSQQQYNNNTHIHHNSHQGNHHPPTFLPPSPKKRGGGWNFAVPANPLSKVELPPPPPPPPSSNVLHGSVQNLNASSSSLHESSSSKYLNYTMNSKPSNNNNHSLSVPNNSFLTSTDINSNKMYLSSAGQSAQLSPYPLSPSLKKPGSGPSTPKSPQVHQVKFTFSSGNSKENLNGLRKQVTRNDSSSSTSSNESGSVPWPVEQMPLIDAFKRGSLIKLASGDLKPVEELRAEDFIHAAANMSDSLRIIHCTVLSIQAESSASPNSLCKVTMAIGSNVQNQQVIVPSSPEQPFFVLGRGWSSLSPKTTEKLLQLPCSTLSVGDVCITLSKTNPVNQKGGNGNGRSQSLVPKSPLAKTKGNGANTAKSRLNVTSSATVTATHSSAMKRPHQQSSTATANSSSLNPSTTVISIMPGASVASTSSSGGSKTSTNSGNTTSTTATSTIAHVVPSGKDNSSEKSSTALNSTQSVNNNSMGPPATNFLKPLDVPIQGSANDDNPGPSSPKRRRWSAPEPEISSSASASETPETQKSTSTTPPPSVISSRGSEGSSQESVKKETSPTENSEGSRKEPTIPDAQSAEA